MVEKKYKIGSKWIKNILGIIIVAFMLWYLSRHWNVTKALLKLGVAELAIIYLIILLNTFSATYVVQCLLKTLKVKTLFWDMVLLQNAATLLNYLPMKFGTLFRANYLKQHYGLSYAHFGTFFLYLMLLLTITSATIGFTVLVTVYDLARYETKILAVAFLSLLVFALFFAFIPLPIPTGSGKLSTTIRNFLTGRRQVTSNKRVLFVCLAFFVGNFILASIKIGIVYNSMSQNIHPAGYLVLGALAYLTMFTSLTPGGLGIRELILSSGAVVLGVPFEVGLFAAIIDRAIALSWSFVGGGISTWLLWRKSPEDFRKIQKNKSRDTTV